MAIYSCISCVTTAKDKYLRSQRGSAETMQAVMGGGAFSTSDHLRMLREERRYGQKYWEVANKTKLKGFV